ncbi:unnamed protein product, partial [marine sediment metagenome]
AHGRPDWSPNEPKETTYAIPDQGEASIRLGGISPFDRLGDVVWFDNFSNGLGIYDPLKKSYKSITKFSSQGISLKIFRLYFFMIF